MNSSLWTFVTPLGDGALTMTGTQLSLTVPAGTSHDVWKTGNFAPRILQATDNSDFEVEVKFESSVTQKYQLQGLLVEEDSGHYLRFGFYFDGVSVRVFAASLWGSSASVKLSKVISGVAPLYMRVKRTGNQWLQTYSVDGLNWTAGANFFFALNATAVGVYAGNAGTTIPAHTALLDYFHAN